MAAASPCLHGPVLHDDPDLCRVWAAEHPLQISERRTYLPSCEDAGPPCYRIEAEPTCTIAPGLAVRIEDPDGEVASKTIAVECVTH